MSGDHLYPAEGKGPEAPQRRSDTDRSALRPWFDGVQQPSGLTRGAQRLPVFLSQSTSAAHPETSAPLRPPLSSHSVGPSDAADETTASVKSELLRGFRARGTGPLDPDAACDRCRRRKIKCDRCRPTCGNCLRLNTTCSYHDILRKRGPPSKLEKAKLEAHGLHFTAQKRKRGRQGHLSEEIGTKGYVPSSSISESGLVAAMLTTDGHYVQPEPAAMPPPPGGSSSEMHMPPPDPGSLLRADEVPDAGSLVSRIVASNNQILPSGGGHDQATAALLQTLKEQTQEPIVPPTSPQRILALDGIGRLFTTDLQSCPKTLAQVFAKYRDTLDLTYFESIGVDVTSAASIRAAFIRQVAHPACTHMSDYASFFLNRAPTLLDSKLRETVRRAVQGGSATDNVPTHEFAIHLIAACLASASCLPLPLEDGKSYAVVLEFGYACFRLAAAVGLPLYGADFSPVDPLCLVQVQSWLSTASLFSDQPVELHYFWSKTAWMSIKQFGFHKVRTEPSRKFDHNGRLTPEAERAEMTVRAVWGIVIVANFQHLLMPAMPPMTDEAVTCSYPSPLDPPCIPASQAQEDHYSEELLMTWSHYTECHHLLQQFAWSPLARASLWEEVEKAAQAKRHSEGQWREGWSRHHSAASSVSSDFVSSPGLDSFGHRGPSDVLWPQSLKKVLTNWSSQLHYYMDRLSILATHANFFKAHRAQPLLSRGLPDTTGWDYLVRHAHQIYFVLQDRVDSVAQETQRAREILDAMTVPLPSDSDTFDEGSQRALLEEVHLDQLEILSSSVSSHSSSSFVSRSSLGAMSAPAAPLGYHAPLVRSLSARQRLAKGTPTVEGSQIPPLRSRPQDQSREPPYQDFEQKRLRLRERVDQWRAAIPESHDEFAHFVVGDLTTPG